MSETFEAQVDKFIGKTFKEFSKGYRKVIHQLYVDIVDGTERDTGTLKNNWQFGFKTNGTTKPKKEYPPGAEEGLKASVAMAVEKVKDEDIFIFNNMDYAYAQEHGLGPGTRTPVRMVQKAIEKMKADIGTKGFKK